MKYYATKEQIDQAELARSVGGKILNHFEDYFNISYPLPKAGLSGFSFLLAESVCHVLREVSSNSFVL